MMKTTIGVMGSSAGGSPEIEEAARLIGILIAGRGATLLTGATIGLPLLAAQGAKQSGGEVIGFSPAMNRAEHQRLGMPVEYHDFIIYTGLGYNGRNLLNIRGSQGVLFVGGSVGALNEFTIGYSEEKILGILEGSGGFCDHMREWIRYIARPNSRAVLHYSSDPVELVDAVFESIRKQSYE